MNVVDVRTIWHRTLREFDHECSVGKERDYARAISPNQGGQTVGRKSVIGEVMSGLRTVRVSRRRKPLKGLRKYTLYVRKHYILKKNIEVKVNAIIYFCGSSRGNISWHDRCQISACAHLSGPEVAVSTAASVRRCLTQPHGMETRVRASTPRPRNCHGLLLGCGSAPGAECFHVCLFLFPPCQGRLETGNDHFA
jgi:hypothetical protein